MRHRRRVVHRSRRTLVLPRRIRAQPPSAKTSDTVMLGCGKERSRPSERCMLFLDSSDPKEIKDIFAWGVVCGVTTNPLILAREAAGVDLEKRIREVITASRGPVSVELIAE